MEQHKPLTRRLRIFLRDFRLVEATVNLAEGQSLAAFFVNRRQYVNVREVFWTGTGERAIHAVLKVEQVLWVASTDGDVLLTHASGTITGRMVEVQLDGGLLLRARMIISVKQRLSDYLESQGRFVPMLGAQLLRSGRPPKRVNVLLGDIVLNQDGIQAAWEVSEHTSGEAQAAEGAEEPAARTTATPAAAPEDAAPPERPHRDEPRPRW